MSSIQLMWMKTHHQFGWHNKSYIASAMSSSMLMWHKPNHQAYWCGKSHVTGQLMCVSDHVIYEACWHVCSHLLTCPTKAMTPCLLMWLWPCQPVFWHGSSHAHHLQGDSQTLYVIFCGENDETLNHVFALSNMCLLDFVFLAWITQTYIVFQPTED